MAVAKTELQPGLGESALAGTQSAQALSWRQFLPPEKHLSCELAKAASQMDGNHHDKKATTFTRRSFIATGLCRQRYIP